jgi:L-lactate dehydrogenase complex protein LldF
MKEYPAINGGSTVDPRFIEGSSLQQVVSEETAHPAHESQPFEERLEEALRDENMHRALERFAPSWRASRRDVFAAEEADYGSAFSFEQMRATLRKAKDDAIEHQPALIAQFKAQAEAAGAMIFEVRTAEDANRYIYDLCQRKGIDLVVKSKTMVSEETELSEATGHEISREGIAEQVAVVRVEHRKAFLNAGMGISGANALIAESGTVMILTNEGNGRLVTSLPPVHVVMAGYEKH